MAETRVRMLPDRLRSVRAQRQVTQEQLAKTAGCSESLVALIETGRRQPSHRMAVALADALGVSLASLAVVIPGDEMDGVVA